MLAARVAAGSWEQLLAGDLANLEGRGSYFAVDAADETLSTRAARLEIHPTGPLWGAGPLQSRARVAELENSVAARFPQLCAVCVAAAMRQERRSLRLAVHDLRLEEEPEAAVLHFRLGRGSFATAVLRELIEPPDGWPTRRNQGPSRSAYTAPVPPSTWRADTYASTAPLRRRTALTAALSTGPRVRAQPLAVDHAHAAHPGLQGLDEELAQRLLRLGHREPVQVDLALHAVLAPAQAPHDHRLDFGPAVRPVRPRRPGPGRCRARPGSRAARRRGRRA